METASFNPQGVCNSCGYVRGTVKATSCGWCDERIDGDMLADRFRESCGLDILGRIAAMLIDRDGFGDVYGAARIVDALEMSASHFNDVHVYRMLDGIAADLAGGFYADDLDDA